MITLKTLANATPQQVFDKVALHLLKQGRKSFRGEESPFENTCAYRGAGGRMCAAGCLIGDDEYRESFEGVAWSVLANDGDVPRTHMQLIFDLQEVHDAYKPEDWKWKLRAVAIKHKLGWSPICEEMVPYGN